MEPGYTLTALVLAIGGLHLVWRAAAFFGLQSERPGTSAKGRRSDWYMFFYRSKLTGDSSPKQRELGEQAVVKKTRRVQPQRRPRAQL